VVEAAQAFKGRRLNDSEYQKAAILGWMVIFVSPQSGAHTPPLPCVTTCVQLHSYFSLSDNIVDQVTTRHGKLSWHRVDDIGFKALNDTLLLEGAVYQLAREHFRHEPYYVDLLDLLHETRHPAYFRNPIPVRASYLSQSLLELISDRPVPFELTNSRIINSPLISEFPSSSDLVRR
jgi:hypothetical protein